MPKTCHKYILKHGKLHVKIMARGDIMDYTIEPYKINTSTREGKLLEIAIARLGYLYKDKTSDQILNMLEQIETNITQPFNGGIDLDYLR